MDNLFTNLINRAIEINTRDEFKTDIYERQYSLKGYEPVKPDLIPTFKTKSLVSIADYIKQNIDKDTCDFVIHVIDHETVELKSNTFGDWNQRETYVHSDAQYPDFSFGRWYDQESFIISLMTKFEKTPGQDYALTIASGLCDGEESKLIDDGMSQKVTLKQGVSLVTAEEVNPYVILQPFRTFREIEQPSSMFLLRVRSGGNLALFEADGGKWKLDAVKNIVEYFERELKDYDYSIIY